MNVPMNKCKQKLGLLWLIGSAILVLIVVLQTGFGIYSTDGSDNSQDVADIFIPKIGPTLTLIITVWVMDAIGKSDSKLVDRFFFRITFAISAFYLLFILLNITVLFQQSNTTPLEQMKQTSIWLNLIQSIACATFGVFFTKTGEQDSSNKHSNEGIIAKGTRG